MGLGGNFQTQKMILERLDRTRFEPIVASPIEGVVFEHFRQLGVECVTIPPPGRLRRYGGAILKSGIFARMKSAFDLLRYNFQVLRFLREKKIDVIYSNCVRAQMSVGLGARLARIPTLMYVKGELANPIIDRICFALSDKILFFCGENRDDKYPGFVRWFARKLGVLEIGLNPAVIKAVTQRDHSALVRELKIDPDCVNAAVVGQLYRPKGQHVAIEAFAKIAAEFSRARLYIIGDHVIDEYRGYRLELDALVEKYGLKDRVFFTGWRRDALDIVATMDMVVHPSFAEGFGRAVLESMALEKPVIASKVGGLREAIKHGQNGFLTEPGDMDAISAHWKELLSSSELRQRLGLEAKRTVERDYQIDDKVERLAGIWMEMVVNGR